MNNEENLFEIEKLMIKTREIKKNNAFNCQNSACNDKETCYANVGNWTWFWGNFRAGFVDYKCSKCEHKYSEHMYQNVEAYPECEKIKIPKQKILENIQENYENLGTKLEKINEEIKSNDE